MKEEPSAPEELVLIRIVQGQREAQIIKGRLESEGIPVVLKYEAVGAIFGLTINGLGEVRVMVPAQVAEATRSALTEVQDEET